MKGNLDYIYNELRETKTELLAYLNSGQPNEKILHYIKAELADIDSALKKIENGAYGKCEISGESLPEEILQSIPTAKSAYELDYLDQYCRKSLY
jgi:RNA polymerase-binding transcription factor DksA